MILLKLFATFFKIGLFTFGGGYAMLPMIMSEVSSNNWMEMTDLLNFVAVSESTPGPFAINIATYVGTTLAGLPGAVCSTLGVVMPSLLVILIVAKCYDKFRTNRFVKGAMDGLKPAAVGLIAAAVLKMAGTVFLPMGMLVSGLPLLFSAILFIIGLLCVFKWKIHPILLIVLCAALGIAAGYAFNLSL